MKKGTNIEQPSNTPRWLRLREVCEVTGWDRWYVRKLVAAGVLTEHRPMPQGRAWYERVQVERVARG